MKNKEILTRLKIGLALVAGFVAGKLAASHFGHHASEFFAGGFLFGVLATQGAWRLLEKVLTTKGKSA